MGAGRRTDQEVWPACWRPLLEGDDRGRRQRGGPADRALLGLGFTRFAKSREAMRAASQRTETMGAEAMANQAGECCSARGRFPRVLTLFIPNLVQERISEMAERRRGSASRPHPDV